jgi:hypothetical protein
MFSWNLCVPHLSRFIICQDRSTSLMSTSEHMKFYPKHHGRKILHPWELKEKNMDKVYRLSLDAKFVTIIKVKVDIFTSLSCDRRTQSTKFGNHQHQQGSNLDAPQQIGKDLHPPASWILATGKSHSRYQFCSPHNCCPSVCQCEFCQRCQKQVCASGG